MNSSIRAMAEEIFDEIVTVRREIHRHPEIGGKEVRTSALIREKLAEYGVEKIQSPVPTAVVALIYGSDREGSCVALRCDIDALPVQEQTGLPYASQNPGLMHACGHDMHTAMLLGTAKLLCRMRDQFSGCVKLIFQHSEDTLPGGAKELVEQGVLENPHVDAIFGMHVFPDDRVGQIGVFSGPVTTSVDLFDFTVSGTGGHGSQPHTTTDPILTAAQMIVMLQQIVARRVNPMETAVFSLGSIHGGDAPNVIPSEVKFGGVSRAYSDEIRQVVARQVTDIAKGMETASGNVIDVYHYEGYPSIFNDPDLVSLAAYAIRTQLGDGAVFPMPGPLPFSEDFSYYGKLGKTPSAYLLLCGGHQGEPVSLHHPKCAMKEEAMTAGVSAFLSVVLEFLKK